MMAGRLFQKVLAAAFFGNFNQLGKKSPPPAGTSFPDRFSIAGVQRFPQFQKLNRRDVIL